MTLADASHDLSSRDLRRASSGDSYQGWYDSSRNFHVMDPVSSHRLADMGSQTVLKKRKCSFRI